MECKIFSNISSKFIFQAKEVSFVGFYQEMIGFNHCKKWDKISNSVAMLRCYIR